MLMNTKATEQRLYELHAELCKALSHPVRLMVVNALRDSESSVSRLAETIGVPVPSLSQHLAVMRQRGIVLTRRRGNEVHYRIANPKMLTAFDSLREALREQLLATQGLAEVLEGEGLRR